MSDHNWLPHRLDHTVDLAHEWKPSSPDHMQCTGCLLELPNALAVPHTKCSQKLESLLSTILGDIYLEPQDVEYMKSVGTECPHCGSIGVEHGNREGEGDGSITVYATCTACGKDWREAYRLVGVLNAQDPEGQAPMFPANDTKDKT